MSRPEVIETTVGKVNAELARHGIGSDERVIITIKPGQELIPGQRESPGRVVAADLSDEDHHCRSSGRPPPPEPPKPKPKQQRKNRAKPGGIS